MAKLGIILVLYKQKHHLELLYRSVASQTFSDFKIYFVDNNNDDSDITASEEINKNFHLEIAYIKAGCNSGFAGGNNLGAKEALNEGCELIFFLNNDTELESNCLKELVDLFDSDLEIGVTGPLILLGNKKNIRIQEFGMSANFDYYCIKKYFESMSFENVKNNLPENMYVDLVSGGAVMVKKEAIEKAGLWEQRYFAYGDEIDFGKRFREACYKTCVTSKAIIWHHHDWNPQNKQSYYFEYYLIERNKFLYFHKYKKYMKLILIVSVDLIKFPVRAFWFIRVCNFRLALYYLRGMLAGILNQQGKPNLNFIE